MSVNQAEPLYRQILRDLKEKLAQNMWAIGDAFPTDRELMETYGVSSITIRRVVLELVNEGWIERRHGIGTFVKKDLVDLGKAVGFFEEVRRRGRKPTAKLLYSGEVLLSSEMIENYPNLKAFKNSRVYLIKRVNYIDNLPVELSDSFWDIQFGSSLARFELSSQGLYELIRHHFDSQITIREQELKAISASPEVARELEINEGTPLLRADRISYDNSKRILEVAVIIYHPTNYRCKIVSSKEPGYRIDSRNNPIA